MKGVLLALFMVGCGRMDVAGEYEGGFYLADDPTFAFVCGENGQPATGHYSIQQDGDGILTGSYEMCGVKDDFLRGYASFDYFELYLLGYTLIVHHGKAEDGKLSGKVWGIDDAVFLAARAGKYP